MKKYLLFSVLFFSFLQINFAQNSSSDLSIDKDPGKCYAKCMVQKQPDKDKIEEIASFYEYLGSDLPDNVVKETILIPATSEWVKYKRSEDCPDEDENCLVYKLEEKSAYKKTFKTVSDTNKVKNFKLTIIYDEKFSSKTAVSDWLEVICDSKLSNQKIKELYNRLSIKGYKTTLADFEELTLKKIKPVLHKYQRENNLPIGEINAPTLESLGLSYWLN